MPESADLAMPNPVATHHVLLDRDNLVAGIGQSVRAVALEYARRGVRVFPCGKDKKPLISGGFKNATVDLAQIESWWGRWTSASIGSPTGREAGYWVLDVDLPDGPQTLARLEAKHGSLPSTREQETGGGGRQLFFKWMEGREVRNNAGTKLGLNIDVRGEGGYVILPPSGHPSGGTYLWLTDSNAELAEAPAWLLDLVCSMPAPPRAEHPRGLYVASYAAPIFNAATGAASGSAQPSAWAQSAFEREIEGLAQVQQGSRNAALFKSAAALGELVAGHALDRHEVEQTLRGTAHALGLFDDEASATIASGFEAGSHSPRSGPRLVAGQGSGGEVDSGVADKPVLMVMPGGLVSLADEAEGVMLRAGVPVYQRGGQLVRIAQLPQPTSEGGVTRAAGSTIIMSVKPNWLLDSLGRLARFVKPGGKGGLLPVDPHLSLAQALLARSGSWSFKPLRGILPGPCLRADGSVINAIGYDERSGYYLAEPLQMCIPDHPTRDDAKKGMALLLGLLGEFPFASEIDKAVALALMLSPLARPAVGRMPLLLVSAPVRGSGKSTLVKLAAVLATGRPAPVIAATASSDELEKRLGTSLLAGDGLILLDNYNGILRSDLLSQAITEDVLRIRVYGLLEQVEVISDSMWVANGNGLTIGGDLSRRALRCTLDPRLERPEQRHFLADPVREAQARRAELVGAALTLMRAFIVAGRPGACDLPPWAGFKGWSELVRAALVWLGLPDPLESADQLQADDPDREILADFFSAWADCLGAEEKTARDLVSLCAGDVYPRLSEVLGEIVGREGRGGESLRLGRWLTANASRVVGGYRLEKAGTSGGSARWRVKSIETA